MTSLVPGSWLGFSIPNPNKIFLLLRGLKFESLAGYHQGRSCHYCTLGDSLQYWSQDIDFKAFIAQYSSIGEKG